MKEKYLAAVDLGASSGRTVAGQFNGSRLKMKELFRFNNNPVSTTGHLYWNILSIYQNIIESLLLFHKDVEEFPDSIGIDSWGVDFILMDKNKEILQNPVHYRDPRSLGMDTLCFSQISQFSLYKETGTASQPFNTLYHLLGIKKNEPWILDNADLFLMIPDYLNYLLTGNIGAELTNASTTQLLEVHTKNWAHNILNKLNLPIHIFPDIYSAPSLLGKLSKPIMNEFNFKKEINVNATASHDTAAAVLALPTEERNPLFLSSGTWSLLGIISDHPVITEKGMLAGITNERTPDGRYRLLRNIMGMWLINECIRYWKNRGMKTDFQYLDSAAAGAEPFKTLINPDHLSLYSSGNMPEKIISLCRKTNQPLPDNQGSIVRCILESIALKYKYTIDILKDISGLTPENLYIVGGGIHNTTLNQMASNATGLTVICGESEASSMGNCISQLYSSGEIGSWEEGSRVVINSTEIQIFKPKDNNIWLDIYNNKFISLLREN